LQSNQEAIMREMVFVLATALILTCGAASGQEKATLQQVEARAAQPPALSE
jgi:hypothetical protein